MTDEMEAAQPPQPQREGGPERCARCGHDNTVWRAPSPLWNAVVRGGCINGEPIFDDMLCAACFMVLAEEKGIAANFRVIADDVFAELQTTTPSGRVWDEEDWLWRPSPNGRGDGLKIQHSPGSNPGDATISTLPAAASVEAGPTSDSDDYRHTFYGILNKQGQFWTPLPFSDERAAETYLARFAVGEYKDMLDTHSIVPVRVRLTAKGKDQA